MPTSLLPSLSAASIIVLVFAYVILDGLDLGAALILPSAANRDERDHVIDAIAPTSFSSELWLIAAAAVAFAAFPRAFSVLAPALSLPILVMLAALAVRALSIVRRRTADDDGEESWSRIFTAASYAAAVAQGLILGGYIKGTSVAGGRFVGSLFDWARPFSFLIAAALAVGYALMGAAWLIESADGAVRERAVRQTQALAIAGAIAMAAISVATLLIHPSVSARWGVGWDGVDWKYFRVLAPLPLAAGASLALCFLFARSGRGLAAFLSSIAVFAAGYGGLIASIWPYIVPFGYTVDNAATDPQTLGLVLIAALCAAPLLLVVSVFAARRAREPLFAPRMRPPGATDAGP